MRQEKREDKTDLATNWKTYMKYRGTERQIEQQNKDRYDKQMNSKTDRYDNQEDRNIKSNITVSNNVYNIKATFPLVTGTAPPTV